MATDIFGTDPESLVEEWRQEGIVPTYGSIENDLLVQSWEVFDEPVFEFKDAHHYDKLKDIVHSNRVSGTFYRDVEDSFNPQPGDSINLYLTSWKESNRESCEHICVYTLTCENVPGIRLRDEIILGECRITVASRTENSIEVRISGA